MTQLQRARVEHGTRTCFVRGCRRPECVAVHRAYEKDRARAKSRPDVERPEPYVPAHVVREHLLELRAAGVGYKRAAEVAGVGATNLMKVLNGTRKRLRRDSAERVLAVTPAHAHPGANVDSAATMELVDRLVAAGVTKVAIARRVHGPQAPALQLLRGRRVSKRHADAVAAMAAEILPAREDDDVRRERLRAEANDRDALYDALADVLEARMEQPWRRHAVCAQPGIATSLFFPERGAVAALDRAVTVCARCPVRAECAAEGEAVGAPGVWGGVSGRERRQARAS